MENRCRNGFGSAFRQESFAPNALEKLFYAPKPLQIEELTRFAELSWSSLSTWNLYSQPESGELWEGNFFRREFFMFATREVSVSVIQFEHIFFVYWNAWGALLDGGNWPDSWINSKQKKHWNVCWTRSGENKPTSQSLSSQRSQAWKWKIRAQLLKRCKFS